MAPTKRKRPREVVSHIVVCVQSFQVRSDVGLNYELIDLDRCHNETPIYHFSTELEVIGECLEPRDRKGHEFKITVVGQEGDHWFIQRKLGDYQRYDKDGREVFKKRRGIERPVYDLPEGVCVLNKVRGEPRWDTYLWAPASFVTHWLTLLTTTSPLYLALHEIKKNRQRWINSLSLDTAEPLEE